MSTSEKLIKPERRNFFSWQLTVVKLLVFLLAAVACEKPVGSMTGKIALEQQGFGQYTYDIKRNKVYAMAMGPRGDDSIERGVWIQPDGSFRIDQLPTGEYSLKIRAEGYSTNYIEGVFVEQGKVAKVQSPIAMQILEPSAELASNSRVFTTTEQPHFWLDSNGGTSAQLKIYKREFLSFCRQPSSHEDDMEIFSNLSVYHPNDKTFESFANDSAQVVIDRKLNPDSQDWSHSEFKLTTKLDPGDYFVAAEVSAANGKKTRAMWWFSVSDLGLVIKQAPEQILVRAVDLNTLKPRSGVSLYAVKSAPSFARIPIGQFKTKDDGFVSIPTSALPDLKTSYDLLICGFAGADHAYGGISYNSSQSSSYQTYFYTERPIYRLGQTVYYKGISRVLAANGFVTPRAGLPLSVTIEDPDNNKIWEGRLQTNSHGSFHGTFDIPEEGKTGAYQISFKYPDNSTDYERFEVAQYRKPEYQVEVTPLEPRVVAGSKVKARIKATYYFGAPVTNARVKYSVYASPDWSSRYKLMPRPDYYGYFDDWSSDYSDDSAGDYICEGYAQTDDSGEAIVEFDTKPAVIPEDSRFSTDYMDKRYKVEAEVTDLSRISVVSSGYASVTAGNFALFVDPQNYVCKAGQPMAINFNAVDYNGKPVANQKVEIKLLRYLYDSVHNEFKGTQTEEQYTATTGGDGKGTVAFRTKDKFPSDTYYITAQASDSGGHTVYDQNSIWIASENMPYVLSSYEAKQQAFTVKLDKPVYKPGETAKIMISAPTDGGDGAETIVAVESTKIHSYQTIAMKATAEMVEVPIDPAYAPNVYITATYVGKDHQFFTDSEMIKVTPEQHFLNVAISTDKEKYKPGDKATYTISATYPDGKPAANCEFSLGVVDESIYAIRPETAEDIKRFFWKRRDNLVTTLCSFPEEYSGGPDKLEPRMRKDFRDTAAWLPELITDNRGIAVATIALPDNLTTWRATVRGINLDADVGQAVQKVISTQDLILRLALPRFFSQGDEGLITAIVHNYTDQPQQVSLSLTATPQFQVSTNLTQLLSAQPDKPIRYSWPVKVVSSGNATISAKAIGQTASDAMELQLPVRPLGVTTFSAKSGLITDNQATQSIPIGLGSDGSLDTAKCSLTMAASSIGPVLGNFKSLIDYPYGCTEQTTSRLIPSTVAIRLHQALGVSLTQADLTKFQKVYKDSLAKLRDYQHDDGGWGWWQYDESNPYLTTYVMEGLYLVQQAGYDVTPYISKDNMDKAKTWLSTSAQTLTKQLQDPKHVQFGTSDREALLDLAAMHYALALYGEKFPDAVANWELSKIGIEYPEALSYLTMAFEFAHDHKSATVAYNQLVSLANKQDQYTDWDHTDALIRRLGIDPTKYSDYTYRFTGVESTALALRAVLATNPQNSTLIESTKQWLLAERGQDGWDTTKTTAQVLRALMKEEILNRQSVQPGFSVSAKVANNQLINLLFNLSNVYAQETNVDVPVTTTSENIDITKQGPGRLYWSSLLTYWRKLKPGDQVNEKAMPLGLHVSRQFFRLKPTITTSDGKVHFTSEPIWGGQIHAGETIMMKVEVDSPIALPYIILDAALPSGGEVVSNDPREQLTQGDNGSSDFEGDWGAWWWAHQDVLDDRIVFFAKELPAGKSVFHTMIRMELPGTLQLNPLTLEGMYTKKIRAYSMLDSLKVVE